MPPEEDNPVAVLNNIYLMSKPATCKTSLHSRQVSVVENFISINFLSLWKRKSDRVRIDRDLAYLYGVSTKTLKQAVRRNIERFPADFMFQLSKSEFEEWRSRFVTSNSSDKMGLRHSPFAFTQEGVAMLSSILKSKRAIHTNIQIMLYLPGCGKLF